MVASSLTKRGKTRSVTDGSKASGESRRVASEKR